MLRAVLIQCLKAGDISNDAIFSVIGFFSDSVTRAFISDSKYHRLDFTDEQWELAKLLEFVGFICSLKQETRHELFRFVPHNSPTQYVAQLEMMIATLRIPVERRNPDTGRTEKVRLWTVADRTVRTWLNEAVAAAASDGVKFSVPVTPHTFRHSYAMRGFL